MSRETQLIFIRHGQHDTSDLDDIHPSGLTEIGRDEARSLNQKLTDPERTRAFSVNNARSLATVAFALCPGIDDRYISQRIEELRTERRLMTSDSLSYAPIADQELKERLNEAFYESRNLEFLVEHTDDYRLKTGDPISSYSTIAYDVANLVKERHEDNLGSLMRDEADSGDVLYCAREFNYACFRAKVEEIVNGVEGRDRFVNWYGENIEWLPEARRDVIPIKVDTGKSGLSHITVSDRYGYVELDMTDINKIIKDYQTKFLK